MRRVGLFGVDLVLVAFGSLMAFALRENFEFSSARFGAFLPYLGWTLVTAAAVIPLLGLSRSIWRFSTLRDYLHLVGATLAIVFGAVLLSFTLNRLDGVARSIPVIQAVTVLTVLVGARVLMRLRHASRGQRPAQFAGSPASASLGTPSVLIVGVNRLTELFLQSAQELSPGTLHVAGLVGYNDRHTGRLMHRHPILGIPEQLPDILNRLLVHGVVVDRIVVTTRADQLNAEAKAALLEIETSSTIRVEFLASQLGLEPTQENVRTVQTSGDLSHVASLLNINAAERQVLKRRPYWFLKRGIDVLGALVLMVVLAPVIVVVSVLVLLDVGLPLVFWQQRPGLGGHPFKLYKFRTMRAAHDGEGRLIPDEARVSVIGRFLRRARLDELPQLYNILIGQMSFIGPRPLLPVDQPVGSETRLLVRPGLTGWAQVKGGRHLSALDKAALDVWYVRHASPLVDIEILLRTIVMVLFGEKENADAIRRAWEEISALHPLRAEPSVAVLKVIKGSRTA